MHKTKLRNIAEDIFTLEQSKLRTQAIHKYHLWSVHVCT